MKRTEPLVWLNLALLATCAFTAPAPANTQFAIGLGLFAIGRVLLRASRTMSDFGISLVIVVCSIGFVLMGMYSIYTLGVNQ